MQPVFEWVYTEARTRLGIFVAKIQSLFRMRKAKLRVRNLKEIQKEYLEFLNKAAAATIIQKYVRRLLGMLRLARVARKTVIHYMPYLAKPYWFNPKMKLKSWTKPKCLHHLESFSVALPEKGLENFINCE